MHDLKTISDLYVKCQVLRLIGNPTIAKLGPLKIKFNEILLPKLLGILSNIQWWTNLKQAI